MNILEYVDRCWSTRNEYVTRRPDHFYASDASIKIPNPWGEMEPHGTCIRAQFYRVTGTKLPMAEMDTRRMDYGNAIHDHETQRFIRARILHSSEVSFYDPEHNVSGRIDNLVYNPFSQPGNLELLGVEVKSVGGYAGSQGVITAKAGQDPEPKVAHVLQCMIYMDWMHRRHGSQLKWLLHYHDRDSGKSAEHVLVMTPDGISVNGQVREWKMADVYARWDLLKSFIEAGQVPPRDYTISYDRNRLLLLLDRQQLSKTNAALVRRNKPVDLGDWQCRYCRWKMICHEGDADAT